MAKFSSIYKQTSPTVRTVQGENTFEKGMYWTNSAIEQGYVHTLLNYDIDALNGTLTVANGFSTCEFAHGGSFVDRLTFGDENSEKILVTQPRNEYLLEAFEGVTNIISVSKITVKNNQHLEESIRLQGFTPENVTCYKVLLYNPVNYRFIVVTMLQASRDKYFIINDKYQLRRLSANPICCGRSDGTNNHGITDHYVPRYLRNNYRGTFSQELYDNRFMQTVPTCEGYGNKSFCFVKRSLTSVPVDRVKPEFRNPSDVIHYGFTLDSLNNFFNREDVLDELPTSNPEKLTIYYTCPIKGTDLYSCDLGLEVQAGSYGSIERLWRIISISKKSTFDAPGVIKIVRLELKYEGTTLTYRSTDDPEYSSGISFDLNTLIHTQQVGTLNPSINTRFIGNFATGMFDYSTGIDPLYPASPSYAKDVYMYGALLTCCYVQLPVFNRDYVDGSFFYHKYDAPTVSTPGLLNKDLVDIVKERGHLPQSGGLIEPYLHLDLITGELTGGFYQFGILHHLVSGPSPDPNVAFYDNDVRDPILFSSIFKGNNTRYGYFEGAPATYNQHRPVDCLSQSILNNLQVGQCLRIAAYCTSNIVSNFDHKFTKYPNYAQYLKGTVKAVYVLNYTWNGNDWDFSFINTDDLTDDTLNNPYIYSLTTVASMSDINYRVFVPALDVNKLLYTDFVNTQNIENKATSILDVMSGKRYLQVFYNYTGTYEDEALMTLDLNDTLDALGARTNFEYLTNSTLIQDSQQVVFEVTPKKLLPSEAALWGYNMLLDNPYNFLCNNLQGSKTAYFTGLLLKDAQDSSKVLINALLNTPSVLELYFNSDFEYFENNAEPTYQLRVEYKNPTDDWRTLRDYTTAETEELLSKGSPIRIDFTGVDEVTIFRATITDTDPEKAITVPNAAGTETETTYLIVHQSLYTVSYTNDRAKLNQSPENFDLGTATGLTFWKGRLVAWGILDADNILFLSEPNDPSYFAYPNSVDTFEENIIHCVTYSDALLVFTNTKLWRLDMNADGLSWNKTLLQQNLRLREEDIPYVTIIKNMLFFKSGNQFYMLVPSSSSTVGELNIAPISNTIRDFLKDPFENIRGLLETVYPDLSAKDFTYGSQGAKDTTGNFVTPTQYPITKYLVKYGTHVEKTKIFVDWWFDLAEFKEQRTVCNPDKLSDQTYLLVQLIYDTATYGWTMQTHFTNTIGYFLSDVANEDVEFVNLLLCPGFNLKPGKLKSTWGVSISKRVEPEESILKAFSYNIGDYSKAHLNYLNTSYNRLQILDTGYKEVTTPALKKRFREIQLMFEADSDNKYGLKALYDFTVDGHNLLSSIKQDIVLKDKLDYSGTLIGKELQIVDSLNIFEEGPENLLGNRLDSTFILDFTALTDTKKVKIRKQVNGKGYLARAKFTNVTPAKYRITNYAFISHNKNTK